MVRAKRYSKDREVKATLFYGMAFLSGTAALIYQVVWVHTLTLTFGSTTVSAAVVIAAFMAGLGLGARCYDILQRRWKNNVMLYAGIECGIALTAAALTLGLRFLPGIYGTLTDMIGTGALLNMTRFTVAFTLLLIPSALIGATFPALSLIVIRSPQGINRHLGMIYGINTLGAAVGTLLSGFVLIELLGNTASVWFANTLNIAVAAAVYSARSRFSQDYVKRAASAKKSATVPTPLPPAVVGIILIASSFAPMAYELDARHQVPHWEQYLRCLIGPGIVFNRSRTGIRGASTHHTAIPSSHGINSQPGNDGAAVADRHRFDRSVSFGCLACRAC
jgi:spermidine synthase